MSPTRTVILAATPRCGARRVHHKDDQPRGQGVHYTCDAPMRWWHHELLWRCTDSSCAGELSRYDRQAA